MEQSCRPRLTGASLIEVVVAIGLVALLLASVAPITARAVAVVEQSRLTTIAYAAAASQTDRLRALPWYDIPGGGTTVLDASSLVHDDGFMGGGPGLSESAGDALETDTPSHSDMVPPAGALPAGAALTRRWRVTFVPSLPSCRLLIVEVALSRVLADGVPMEQAALGRAQTIRCADGARP
jgi:type II secretory pathway pseudopilin PulG